MTKPEQDTSPDTHENVSEDTQVEESSLNELLKEELEKQKLASQELKDANLRQLAELENTRKRLQKEREDLTKYAICRFAEEFLNPLDQMERALGCAENMNDEIKNWAIGFKMIMTQFHDILAGQNIQSYSAMGKAFDPHLHEAVEAVETTDAEDGMVIEELVKGYKMGDYVVRPAKVKVAKQPVKAPETDQKETSNQGVQDDKEK